LLNLLSVYNLFRFVKPRTDTIEWRWLILWALASLAGIYTHYFGFFVFAFGVLCLAAHNLKSKWLWIALGLSGLFLLPILPVALNRFAAGQQVDFVHVPTLHLLDHAASAYSVGMHPTVVQPAWRVIPVVILAIAGVLLNMREKQVGTILLLGYQVVPLAILIALSAYNPLYNGPRHLLMGLPPYLILVAAGALSFGRRQRWFNVLFGLVLLSQIQWLNVQFTSADLVKDDVQSAADYLDAAARPDDVILLHDTLIQFTFDYYYDGTAPWITIPQYGQGNVQAAITQLEEIGRETNGRVWFLTEPKPRTGFPPTPLIDQANQNWQHLFGRYFDWLWLRVRLDGYLPNPTISGLPESAIPTDACWSNSICLQGYQLETDLWPGNPWWPSFYWSMDPSAQQDELTLSLRLTDASGQVWLQRDQTLGANGQTGLVQHQHQADLPAGIPPGSYQLWLRVLSGGESTPLGLSNGQESLLLQPTLTVASAASGTARWLGSALELSDYHIPEAKYRPGHPIPVEINWHVHRSPTTDLQLELQLTNKEGTIVSTGSSSPTRTDYPTTQWRPGETLLSIAGIQIPPQASAGRYTISASMINPEKDTAVTIQDSWLPFGSKLVTLGEIEVVDWPMTAELPAMGNESQADFGSPTMAKLYGYDLQRSDKALVLTLYWQAISVFDADYKVFVHLADETEHIAVQSDSVPAEGTRPTTTWRTKEYIIDTHTLALPTLAPDHTYNLWIGLYNDQLRLPIVRNGEQLRDGRLLLQVLESQP